MKRIVPLMSVVVILVVSSIAAAQTTSGSAAYSFVDRGGYSIVTSGGSGSSVSGYARVQPGGGTTGPAGVAIFGSRQNGVLVSEAGVPAMTPMLSGRMYAEVNGPINTGVAFMNPNSVAVTISFYFTDQAGIDRLQGSFILDAGAQSARFINETPFSATGFLAGTFTFAASAPVGVISLRTFINERNEFTMTTQTVSPLTGATSTPLIMAHFADGDGWKTQVLLVNTTDAVISGNVQFYGEGSGTIAATPVALTVNGQVGVSFSYAIAAHASVKLETSGIGSVVQTGSVKVTPNTGSNAPSGYTAFSQTVRGVTMAQASVAGQTPSTAFRMYVEEQGTAYAANSIDSGIAITNTSSTNATINFELMTLAGVSTGFVSTISVPGLGHTARFLSQIAPGLSLPFRGVLRINAGSTPIVVTGLRTRYNERGDFLITTTPASNEFAATTIADVVFPHIVDMGGYTTQFVLFSGTQAQSGVGLIRFYNQSGQAMSVRYQ